MESFKACVFYCSTEAVHFVDPYFTKINRKNESNLLCFQIAEEAVEAEPEIAKEPEMPNFTKVCSLSLSEVGLPPRMFTAGR